MPDKPVPDANPGNISVGYDFKKPKITTSPID